MSRAERIMAMAVERGPLGVRQYDFDYPARDKGPELKAISTIIGTAGLGLVLVHGDSGPVWYLPDFVPDELMRTGWGCLHSCGAVHTANWVEINGPTCGGCGGDGLVQARIMYRRPESQAA